ncbi:uncharacterized protein KRP23_1532 [Phytophthora ramorum]|nr:hypothetical protein KRP23_13437 [Phytophthora ramorum]KAH7492628.1 hypothetical protein KRP23_1532 [Phytophthora ramorum]
MNAMSTRNTRLGTVNYSEDEMQRLNAKVRAVLPRTDEDWLRVAYDFNHQRPSAVPFRGVDSLKRKFTKMLYCSRGARVPDYVVEARRVRDLISQRSEEDGDEMTEAEGRDLALRLQQMEEEYRPVVEGRRLQMTGDETVPQISAGGIGVLRRSVEGKRRFSEDQTPSGRKKLKVWMPISRVRELMGSWDDTATETEEASTPASTLSAVRAGSNRHTYRTSVNHQGGGVLSDSGATPPPAGDTARPASTRETQPSGVMDLLLQLMAAQQIENTHRLEAEQARREQEKRERDARRRQKDLQRQQNHRELMLAMAAMVGDRFPDSLKHYLNEDEHPSRQ